MTNLVTRLTWEAIDTAVVDACRWDSPRFAQARVRVALSDLHGKIDRLQHEPLAMLAADLDVVGEREAIKTRINELAANEVTRKLDARTAERQGWKRLPATTAEEA